MIMIKSSTISTIFRTKLTRFDFSFSFLIMSESLRIPKSTGPFFVIYSSIFMLDLLSDKFVMSSSRKSGVVTPSPYWTDKFKELWLLVSENNYGPFLSISVFEVTFPPSETFSPLDIYEFLASPSAPPHISGVNSSFDLRDWSSCQLYHAEGSLSICFLINLSILGENAGSFVKPSGKL